MSHRRSFENAAVPRGSRRAAAARPVARAALAIGAALATLALVSAPAAAQQSLKIGYVDSNRIIEATPGVAEAKDTYQKQADQWKTELDAKKKELSTLYEEYNKQAAILSPEKKTEKQQVITQKEREMQEYFQTKFGPQGEAGVKEKELLKPIYDRINKAIEEVRASEKYALIFDIQAGALAAGDPSLDLTDKVIARLKTQGSTASAAGTAGAAPAGPPPAGPSAAVAGPTPSGTGAAAGTKTGSTK
jgi:outer membrane protein